MKKTTTTLLGVIIAISSTTFCYSQADFEGEITYSIEYGQLPEQPGIEEMLPNEMKLSIKGNKTRIDQTYGAGTNSQIMVYDYENKIAFVAISMMGQKMLINIDEKSLEESLEKNKNAEVVYFEEYKDILGYKCQKATINADGQLMTVYFTEKLPNRMNQQMMSLKGMPLEYSINVTEISMSFSASSIQKTSVSELSFAKPTGYQELSIEDLKSMGGGDIKF